MDKLIQDFSYGLFIWQVLVFVLLIFLLRKFAWKPILDTVNERESSIKNAMSEAEKARNEMASINACQRHLCDIKQITSFPRFRLPSLKIEGSATKSGEEVQRMTHFFILMADVLT